MVTLSRLPTLCVPPLPLCPICQTADPAQTTPLPLPLFSSNGRRTAYPMAHTGGPSVTLKQVHCYSLSPGQHAASLFTPQCPHTLHHVRCLVSWLCLISDGISTDCDTAQVDYMVESLLLHKIPFGSQLYFVFNSCKLVQVLRRPPSLGHSHRKPNASTPSGSTPNPQLSLSASVTYFKSGLIHTQTAALCSASSTRCHCVLRNTPFGARSHFSFMKTYSASATATTRGKSLLLMPPRGSPFCRVFWNGYPFQRPPAAPHRTSPTQTHWYLQQYQQLQWL